MRRILSPVLAVGLLAASAVAVLAQQPPGQTPADKASDARKDEENRQRRIDRQFERDQLPVPNLNNAGPCPFVKVLYDASRMVEFTGAQKTASNVAYSGEIDGVTATCSYKAGEPIAVEMITTFAIGKGPQASGDNKPVTYWIAVTDRDRAVLGKERFNFTAHFPQGSDRVLVFEITGQIVIPRANESVSCDNFEILVGFDVTPEQAAFNRDGNRFLVKATGQTAQSAGAPPAR